MHLRPRLMNSFVQASGNMLAESGFSTKRKITTMTAAPKSEKASKVKTLFYIILGIVFLTVFLEMTGMADVAGKREHQEIIDRPHD